MKTCVEANEIEKEMQERKRKRTKDLCFGCPYGKAFPCIGFCYKQMTANPVEEEEES